MLEEILEQILNQYSNSFIAKIFGKESLQEDILMQVFGLTQIAKAQNRQYWGRELGMCWQRLVTQICKEKTKSFLGPIREGADEICDLVIGKDAIDTKYRIGSGDSGTLKKFKQYGKRLTKLGYRPVLLILRTDNLSAAITACKVGGWKITQGSESFEYIKNKTGFDLQAWLIQRKNKFSKPKELS